MLFKNFKINIKDDDGEYGLGVNWYKGGVIHGSTLPVYLFVSIGWTKIGFKTGTRPNYSLFDTYHAATELQARIFAQLHLFFT